jgi:hypothetical protein
MNVTTIEMDRDEALAKVAAWMQEKHADQAVVREQCIKGYEALAEGKRLIQLDAAIRGGGFYPAGHPKLAVARADRREVFMRWSAGRQEIRFDTRQGTPYSPRGNPGTLVRTINAQRTSDIWHVVNGERKWLRDIDGFAQVPLLPADCRPQTGQLRDWFILWEVERWYSTPDRVEPDRDPMLLEHVAGQLYAVLAEWDLTELERAVMAGALAPEAS